MSGILMEADARQMYNGERLWAGRHFYCNSEQEALDLEAIHFAHRIAEPKPQELPGAAPVAPVAVPAPAKTTPPAKPRLRTRAAEAAQTDDEEKESNRYARRDLRAEE